jgi:excisionase family DNA binding protein
MPPDAILIRPTSAPDIAPLLADPMAHLSDRPEAHAVEPLLVPAREAARLLAVSERTLWGLTRRGEVPCVRIGRAVRYDPRDLAAYVERLRAPAAEGVAHG